MEIDWRYHHKVPCPFTQEELETLLVILEEATETMQQDQEIWAEWGPRINFLCAALNKTGWVAV